MEIEGNIPIVFFHLGGQKYLKTAINVAEKCNEVFLIGDDKNKSFCKNWVDYKLFHSDSYEEFKKIYIHMSSNNKDFELACFQRYFYLYEFMRKRNLQAVIMVDSDVLVLDDLNMYFKENICGCALSIPKYQEPYVWAAGPQCSYWTIKCLFDFLSYLMELYLKHIELLEKKYEYTISNELLGGVCDMTALYLWSRERQDILNLSMVFNHSVFDHSLQSASNYLPNEFQYNKIIKMKTITYIDGKLYFTSSNNLLVQAITVHCQGSCKSIMPYVYSHSNVIFIFFARYIEYAKRLNSRIRRKIRIKIKNM